MPVVTGKAEYPENILDKIRNKGVEVVSANALELAEQAGSVKL